jgi:hypothetical protein
MLTAGLVTLAALWLTQKRSDNARMTKQDARIDELTLQLLALSTKDIQTLCGESDRKEWLKVNPVQKAWASTLLQTQQKNAITKPLRPIDAEKQLLYNGAELGMLNVVEAGLRVGFDPNHEDEIHKKFGTTPL